MSCSRSSSLPNLSSHYNSLQHSTPRHHTMDNFQISLKNNMLLAKRKSVKFSDKTKVVLVPCRDEYKNHNLNSLIWWERSDYDFFKTSAKMEVVELLEKYSGNLQHTLAALYQPGELPAVSPQLDIPSVGTFNGKPPLYSNLLTVRRRSIDLSTSPNDTVASSTDDQSSSLSIEQLMSQSSQGNSPIPIHPVDIFFTKPEGKQARDSLRNVNEEGHKILKPVHPLALMTYNS